MLNQTSRKQVERVLPEFRRRWPGPEAFVKADNTEVATLIAPLGLLRRRTVALKKMTASYLAGQWSDPRELPGIGEYAARAWEIFCKGELGVEPPKDHALAQYYHWAKQHGHGKK